MKKDAEVHADEDKKKKEAVEVRNTADTLVFNLEKQMREHDAKLPDDLKKKVNTKMNDLKDVLKNDKASVDEIKRATESLATEAQEMGKLVYEEAAKKAKEEESAKAGKGKEKVVDAEVKDEKEKKDRKKK